MTFIVATTSLPVDRPNADRLERRTLVPITYLWYLQELGEFHDLQWQVHASWPTSPKP